MPQVPQPLLTKWCLDPTPAAPGESYDEENAQAPPIGVSASQPQPSYEEPDVPEYEPATPLDTGYLSPGAARTGRQFNRQQFQQAPPPVSSSNFNRNGRNFGTPF